MSYFPSSRAARLGIGLVFLIGLGIRLWMTTQPLGTLDSDMAVLGLMAREAQHGHFSVFHWGQYYGGAQETYLAAILGIFTGVNKFVLQLTTIVLSLTTVAALWFAARQIFDARTAWWAAVLFWVWPGPFVWWSVKIGSNYWFAATIALTVVYLLARMKDRVPTQNEMLLTGFLLGLTVWANPQAAYIVVPAMVRYFRVFVRARMKVVWMLTSACLGAAPWLVSNFQSGFASLFAPGGVSGNEGKGLGNFFHFLAPMVLGFRVPFTGGWQLGVAGPVLAVLLALVILFGALRTKPRPYFPLIALAVGCTLFVSSQWVLFQTQPRYLFWLTPWLILLAAVGLARVPAKAAWLPDLAVVFAVGLSGAQLSAMNTSPLVGYRAPDPPIPMDDSDLVSLLDEHDVTNAFGDYWLAYRVTFESKERITIAPFYTDRHRPYTARVMRSNKPALVFLRDSVTYPRVIEYCAQNGISCPTFTKGAFAVILPDRLVTPAEIEPLVTTDFEHKSFMTEDGRTF